MPGYDVRLPRRIVVDEVITTGTAQSTGISGWVGQGAVLRYNSWATPLPPSSSARVLAATAASTSATTTITTGITNPDYPRVLRVVPSTSAFSGANSSVAVVVTGTNQFGATVTDTISMGNGTGPVDGQVAFRTVTSIVLPACSSAGTNFTIGLSNTFGLDRLPGSVAAVMRGAVNFSPEATAPVIGAPSTSGTVSPAAGLQTTTFATAKFNTAATSSAGAKLEIYFVPQDTAHA